MALASWLKKLGSAFFSSNDKSAGESELVERERELKAAAESNQLKSEFLANVSHEVRTPINAILGMTQLCLKTELNEQQRGYLRSIESSSKTLLAIVNDLLDFSKVEAGKLAIETIPFNLEEVLSDLADMFAYRAYDKNLEFIINLPPNIPARLIGDPLRLNQVLVNLLSNAIKFTEHGEIVVEVTLLDQNESEVYLRLSVTDTGIGMSESQRAKLFNAFTQADASTTRRFGGTGLGLAISQRIVKLMNQHGLGVTSSLGQGSTFFLELTLPLQAQQDSSTRAILIERLEKKRVLAIEDNLTTREMLTELLRSYEVDVTTCRSAEEALGLISQHEFDAVIVDWQLPGMSGLDFCREVLAANDPATPKLILATSYHAQDMIDQAKQLGVAEYIVKPYTSSALIRVLCSALALHADERPAIEHQVSQELIKAPILLVEDNDINQLIAKEMLTHAGVCVDLARNGEEAVNMVSEKTYGLVFMDIQMPVMDGLTAAEKIRGRFSYQELPIIAMTANTSNEDVERSQAAGMQAHISKPIDEKLLLEALDKWCVRGLIHTDEAHQVAPPTDPAPDSVRYPNHTDIDFQSALERLGHNMQLYQTLIDRLYQDYHQAPQQVVEFLSTGQHDQAKRFFHSLKGAAANLGLTRLADTASQLEESMSRSAIDEVADRIIRLDPLLEQARQATSDLLLWQQRQSATKTGK